MESILNTIFSTENIRTLATLVSIFSCFVWLKTSITSVHRRIDGVEASLNKRIDGVEISIKELKSNVHRRIDDLKHNDFAHLNGTIEALTYALEKNGSLKKEDKDYVDSRLAR